MKKILLRKAELKDMLLLYKWANDPIVRQNSFHSESISFEEHQKWFNEKLNNPNEVIYILLIDGQPIGQVRLHRNQDKYEISYSVASSYRGQGYGNLILRMIEDEIKDKNFMLVGRVKKINIASQLIFKTLGYHEEELENYFEYTKIMGSASNDWGGVLLLTNNRNSLNLYNWLRERVNVSIHSNKLNLIMLNRLYPKFIISYNYRYIISDEIIKFMKGNIINLHISYLPWNRGSSPNLWSFIDDTPKGITIHKLDSGLDTGEIIYQKQMYFDEDSETLASSYQMLNEEIVNLLKQKWDNIYNGNYISYPQKGKGTYHKNKDLEKLLNGKELYWNMTIQDFKKILKSDDDVKK